MKPKRRLLVEFGGARRIEIPNPEKIRIEIREERPLKFDLDVNPRGLRNLQAVFKKLGGKK